MPTAEVNGTELFYELEGRGEPLVLVHGSWGDHFNWQGVVPKLADSFRVLTYDRRGHSKSQRPGEGIRRDDEDDLGALLESLDLVPAHVAGNSFGASITLGLAARRPELFRTVMVHEPPLLAIASDDPAIAEVMAEFQTKIEAVAERLEAGDIPGGSRQFVEDVALGAGAWDQLPDEVRETFITNALTWLDEMKDPDWPTLDLKALAGLSSPVLLSEGDQSPPWFPVINHRLSQVLKNCERHVYGGAGHVPYMTHPQEVVRTMTEFVRGTEEGIRA